MSLGCATTSSASRVKPASDAVYRGPSIAVDEKSFPSNVRGWQLRTLILIAGLRMVEAPRAALLWLTVLAISLAPVAVIWLVFRNGKVAG